MLISWLDFMSAFRQLFDRFLSVSNFDIASEYIPSKYLAFVGDQGVRGNIFELLM